MSVKDEARARAEIRELVSAYYHNFKKDEEPFRPGDRIRYSGRVYDEKEMLLLTDAMLDFWLTARHFAEDLETRFADFLGVRYAHLVNSGSSANLLALSILTARELGERRLCPGDEVITVAAAFPTTVAPILQCGAVPVFLDMTIPQYNMDTTMLEEARTERTKAVFLAHTLGNPFDLKTIRAFCDKYDLWLIEDNCDALGSEYTIDGITKKTGAWGDISTGSFYPPHHITMGEGGIVCTNDPLLHRLILSFRDWGRDCVCPPGHDDLCGHRFDGQFGQLPQGYDHKYVYSHFGYNLKMTDMQAAVGCAQLEKLPEFIRKRRENWEYLRKGLEPVSDRLILPEAEENSIPSWFAFVLSIRPESGLKRNEVTRYMESRNIQTRLLFSGNILKHPCFDELHGTGAYRVVGDLEDTDRIMEHTFLIGVYPGMTKEMLDYMLEVLKEAVNG